MTEGARRVLHARDGATTPSSRRPRNRQQRRNAAPRTRPDAVTVERRRCRAATRRLSPQDR
jgi:hypothetical protein